MYVPNRRLEVRLDIIESLRNEGIIHEVDDLSGLVHSSNPSFLEGTGALVLDRINHLAFVSLSPRAHLDLAQKLKPLLPFCARENSN